MLLSTTTARLARSHRSRAKARSTKSKSVFRFGKNNTTLTAFPHAKRHPLRAYNMPFALCVSFVFDVSMLVCFLFLDLRICEPRAFTSLGSVISKGHTSADAKVNMYQSCWFVGTAVQWELVANCLHILEGDLKNRHLVLLLHDVKRDCLVPPMRCRCQFRPRLVGARRSADKSKFCNVLPGLRRHIVLGSFAMVWQ